MSVTESLLTAEEFGALPDDGRIAELVRGKIVVMNQPYSRHGEICNITGTILRSFVKPRKLGRVFSDSGVVTERDPDTVRGPDVAYVSYGRAPAGRLPRRGYLAAVPEVVFEVRSPDDRWPAVLAKVAEYHVAGVLVAVVLEDEEDAAYVYRPGQSEERLTGDQALSLPEVHAEFHVRVGDFFED